MRSSREIEFAKSCDNKNIKWEYEPRWFLISKKKRCLPDFYLNDLDIWIEIKPKYFQSDELLNRGIILNINYKVLSKENFEDFFRDII